MKSCQQALPVYRSLVNNKGIESTFLCKAPRPSARVLTIRHAATSRHPLSFPLRPRCRPRPRSRLRCRSCLRSHPRSRFRSHPRSRLLLSGPRTRLPLWYDVRVQTRGLTNGAVGCSQAPPPVCRDGDACGMKELAVRQKRIAAEDVLLPSLHQMLGLVRVGIRPVLYPCDGELLDKGMHF